MPRLALGLEYVGSGFCGWQRQVAAHSVQAALEQAVSCVADAPVSVVAAGRTDAGVHAIGQVVHFDSTARRNHRAWLLGINSNLPPQISVSWVRVVDEKFHARHSALSRTYQYLIFNRPVRCALHDQRAWWVRGELDLSAMSQAAAYLLGEHDFSAFRAAQCQSPTSVRELRRLQIRRRGAFIVVECEANAFLHHMVRNIVGSLVRVGLREETPQWLGEVLVGRDRHAAGMTADAGGLYLTRIRYPEEFAIPAPDLLWPGDL